MCMSVFLSVYSYVFFCAQCQTVHNKPHPKPPGREISSDQAWRRFFGAMEVATAAVVPTRPHAGMSVCWGPFGWMDGWMDGNDLLHTSCVLIGCR